LPADWSATMMMALSDSPRPRRLSRAFLRILLPLSWLTCAIAWLLIVRWHVETVLATGPMILSLGVLMLVLALRMRHRAGIVLATSHIGVVVLFVGLVNALSWSPSDAAQPFGVMGVMYVLASGGLMIYGLRTIPRLWDEDHCQACGYPRRGVSSDRCPECGEFWEGADAMAAASPERA
jgi:hypothetical protein